ncbi:MAG: bifunctional nuclease family protein [Verrucomicrobia bacterium]|nr:bifunctional nuclease family protein [Verrucomicrobiota bacterium]
MSKPVVKVQVKAVLPTKEGCAVFLGNDDKAFIIFVDQSMGAAITMFMRETPKERPLTHDLMADLLTAMGAKVQRAVINNISESTYYARLIVEVQNEITRQRKIVELDSRPSDAIALAIQQKAPIYVSQNVWDDVEDMSDKLREMEGDFEV